MSVRQAPASPEPSVAVAGLKRLVPSDRATIWRLVAFVLVVVFFGVVGENFWSRANWLNTSVFATTTMLLVLAQVIVILTSGIDLSVGSALAVSGAVSAYLLEQFGNDAGGISTALVVVGLAAGVATGALIGLTNGLLITRLEVPPFIVTLGMLGVCAGLALIVTDGVNITVPDAVAPIGNTVWLDWIPVTLVVACVLWALAWYVLGHTRFGIHTYAIGNDEETARRMGVDVRRHLTVSYTLSGTLAGVAGVLLVARFLVGSPDAGGEQALLNAVAAAAIGGVSLYGGKGTVNGAVIGAAIVAVAVTGLVLAGVQSYWQTVVVGIVIVGAVYLQNAGSRGGPGLLARLGRASSS